MKAEDPIVIDILSRSMVARIATLSRNGRPSINPLYYVFNDGKIWLGTPDWTLAVRNIKADPRVSVLFEVEKDPNDRRVLRISGQAIVRVDAEANRSYNLQAARKYIFTPGGLHNWLTHPRQVLLRRYYTAQSKLKGQACVIEVTPERIELV